MDIICCMPCRYLLYIEILISEAKTIPRYSSNPAVFILCTYFGIRKQKRFHFLRRKIMKKSAFAIKKTVQIDSISVAACDF